MNDLDNSFDSDENDFQCGFPSTGIISHRPKARYADILREIGKKYEHLGELIDKGHITEPRMFIALNDLQDEVNGQIDTEARRINSQPVLFPT